MLIVTEGEQTEVQYLQGVTQHLRATGARVVSVNTKGVGRDPLKVVRAGLDIANRDDDGYDAIWVVVDVDTHTTLDAAIALGRKHGIPVVVSNPCFEIWLLWHYADCTAFCSSLDLKTKLKRQGHGDKHLPASFPFANVQDAMRRASLAPHSVVGPNPSSAMGQLMTSLYDAT